MTPRLTTALIVLLALALCLVMATAAFADKGEKDQKLTIDQLPAAVRATLESQAQGNPIEDLEKEEEDGVVFYSADIIQGDKKLEVEIAKDGKLLKSRIESKDGDSDEESNDKEHDEDGED